MISVQKVLVLVGILVFGCLLAYAQGIDIQDGTTEKTLHNKILSKSEKTLRLFYTQLVPFVERGPWVLLAILTLSENFKSR